ncbi:hypothetical protein Q0601_00560 [Paracoccus onubensis]|uniref:hypothetical protein n=1 Tax=Paracoccus onubensis TaxID=1675788 RepID=UPI0027310235|nr:hypothetical protein [Paracoccus onubensis]MDP0925653.1 hypothetical protein [Paracoccus onubensis]
MRKLVFALALAMASGTAQADKRSLVTDWGGEISKAILEAISQPPVDIYWHDGSEYYLYITVKRDGTVVDIRSSAPRDDQIVIEFKRRIMKASPLPPAPKLLSYDTYSFAVPVGM